MSEQQNLKQKDRLIELLYQTLKEIKEVNDTIISDTNYEFKAVDVSYLNGFIDGKVAMVEDLVENYYEEDSE